MLRWSACSAMGPNGFALYKVRVKDKQVTWSSILGVARCGRSAGCVLCALWAVPAAVGEGVPCGGKHIIIVTHTNTRQEQHHTRPHEGPPPLIKYKYLYAYINICIYTHLHMVT